MIIGYFDGACEPKNPGGTAAYGVAIYQNDDLIHTASEIVGSGRDMTCNVAEYSGILNLLQWLLENNHNRDKVMIHGDSMLVINQLFGKWRMKSGLYRPYAIQAKKLLPLFTDITGAWISRNSNTLVDDLSKQKLRDAGIKFRIQPEE